MTSHFRDFSRALRRAEKSLLDAPILRAKQDLARRALIGVVERTPVATGHARANWQVSVGAPSTGLVAGRDPSGAATLTNGFAAIMADTDPFATVWVVNNAPYIQTLEQGRSEQAPAGMVATTLAGLSR